MGDAGLDVGSSLQVSPFITGRGLLMESAEDEDRPSQKQSRICNKRELLWSQARAGKWAPIGLMAEKRGGG